MEPIQTAEWSKSMVNGTMNAIANLVTCLIQQNNLKILSLPLVLVGLVVTENRAKRSNVTLMVNK